MLFRKTAILIPLLFCFAANVPAQGESEHLRAWVGRHPINQSSVPPRNIFERREIRGPLLKLLGARGFKRLLNGFGLVEPITRIEDYLVIEGAANLHFARAPQNALVAFNLNGSGIHVAVSTLR